MLFIWEDNCRKRTRTGKERQAIRRADDFQVLGCVEEGPLESEWRTSSDFLIWKMWLKIFSADSIFEILERDGLGQVVTEGKDICGLWNFTILSGIIGLDLLFAHASLNNTHFAHDVITVTRTRFPCSTRLLFVIEKTRSLHYYSSQE